MADVPQWLSDAGATAGVVAAVVGCVVVLVRLRPVRWLGRTIVAEPVARWFRREVREVVDDSVEPIKAELRTNGGTSVKDSLGRLERDVKRLQDLRELDADGRYSRQVELDRRLTSIDDSLANGATWMRKADEKLTQLCGPVASAGERDDSDDEQF